MSVHEKIKQVRQLRGLTQADMAEKLEMSENGYSNIERGKTHINETRLEKICQILGISLADLFSLDSKNTILNLAGQQNITVTHCNVINGCISECLVKAELDKQQSLNAEKDKRIALLMEFNELLKKNSEST